jgi:hypothetical protein
MGKIPDEYETQIRIGLKEMQKRRRRLHVLLIAEALALIAISRLLLSVSPIAGPFASLLLGLLLFGLSLRMYACVSYLPCPLCRKPFSSYYYDFGRRCLNCGLKLNGSNIHTILESRLSAEQEPPTTAGHSTGVQPPWR